MAATGGVRCLSLLELNFIKLWRSRQSNRKQNLGVRRWDCSTLYLSPLRSEVFSVLKLLAPGTPSLDLATKFRTGQINMYRVTRVCKEVGCLKSQA